MRSGSAITVEMGAPGGTSGSRIGPGNQPSSGSSYRIGRNNQDATFAGRILADGVNTITKVGTGNWTLTGANTCTGSISGAVTVNSGGTIAPGSRGSGTLTMNNSLSLNSGARLSFELGTTATSNKIVVSGAFAPGGTLNVTNVAGFGAGTYTLISYGGALSGKVPIMTAIPPGYDGSVNTNTSGQVGLVVCVLRRNLLNSSSITASPAFSLFSGQSSYQFQLKGRETGLPGSSPISSSKWPMTRPDPSRRR